jgi:hypothetical protein
MNDISARDRVLKALAEVERLELERKWAIREAIYGPVELNKYERCRKSRKTFIVLPPDDLLPNTR